MLQTEVYYPDGRVLVLAWDEGTRPALRWLQRALGGYIEAVDRFLPDGGPNGRNQAFCHEEGRIIGLEVNVPGMKALHWPEPAQGWDAYQASLEATEGKAGEPDAPILLHGGMSREEFAAAERKIMQRWDPICGPVVITRGWTESEYDDREGVDPQTFGEEHRIAEDGRLVPWM